MRYWLPALLIATLLFFSSQPVLGMAQSQVTGATVEYTFGGEVIFKARLASDVPVQEVLLFFKSPGDTSTEVVPANLQPQGEGTYEISYVYDQRNQPLRAFSEVSYRYQVKDQQGQEYLTPTFSFYYEDNRFGWKTLEEAPFRVHWYQGQADFGQKVLDVAHSGLEHVQSLLALPDPGLIDIYVYNSSQDLQVTLGDTTQNWVAGHADPDLGVVVVALPESPDQRLLMEQRIPHELMHILLFQSTGAAYKNLPTWLSEGLAAISELYPNPDYQILLNDAYTRENLLPFSALCGVFPRDASGALLAYAESASLTRFLYRTYGTSGLEKLVSAYGDGLDCQRGAEAALGKDLNRLEREWRQDHFAEDPYQMAFTNLLPWVALMITALAAPFAVTIGKLRRA